MGLYDALNVAILGMSAQQRGLQVTGNNIANVSTPGYHRQEVVLGALPEPGGVAVLDVRAIRDGLLEARLDGAAARKGAADATATGAADLEQLLGDLGDTGLGAALSRFFSSWQALSAAPNDLSARQSVLAASQRLAGSIGTAAQGLVDQGVATNQQLVSDVGRVNGLIDHLADLDRSILQAETSGGQAAELRDQRTLAQRELATIIGSTAGESPSGEYFVTVGGVSLVQGSVVHHLEATADATSGRIDLSVAGTAQGSLGDRLGGAMGATLRLRDVTLPGLQASLDDFASSLVSAVNGAHAAGFGLDGVSGRNLFVLQGAGSGAAASMSVDPVVAADPRRLAAAQSAAGLPGDNRVAASLATLQSQLVAGGGTVTLAQALADLQSSVGEASLAAQNEQSSAALGLQYLSDLRESVSGVSLEEQMALLTRYQRAYQAASKVISTIDEMLDTVLKM